MNLFIYLACIVIALRFIFNGKEARKINFCSLVFRVIFNVRNLKWPAYIGEEDYHAPIDEKSQPFYSVMSLFQMVLREVLCLSLLTSIIVFNLLLFNLSLFSIIINSNRCVADFRFSSVRFFLKVTSNGLKTPVYICTP